MFKEDEFQTSIYEAKMKYPGLFEEFSFSLGGTQPYSRLLDGVLRRGHITRNLLETEDGLSAAEGFEDYTKRKIKPLFSREEITALKQIGEEFRKKMDTCQKYSPPVLA